MSYLIAGCFVLFCCPKLESCSCSVSITGYAQAERFSSSWFKKTKQNFCI